MKFILIALLSSLLFPLSTLAHGPTPQKAKESIVINASVEAVWNAVKQFDAIANWHPDVKASAGDGKHESGGIRTITLQNNGQLIEELDYYNDQDHEYNYRLKTENVKAFPTSSYSISLQVKAGDDAGHSEVLLKSRFYRGDTGNSPPENLNDEAAVAAMNQFFKNGLAGLKQKLEN
ncbi:MAG: SRPBCC family protein [Methylococcaceae bacterium]|nr:SRPBCC family protein [Methylococcaceae bacterium]